MIFIHPAAYVIYQHPVQQYYRLAGRNNLAGGQGCLDCLGHHHDQSRFKTMSRDISYSKP